MRHKRRRRRHRRNPVTGTAKVRWNPKGDTGKIVLAVAATAIIAGGIGAFIYFKKPSTSLPGSLQTDRTTVDTAADKAAADKAAADAAAKAAADAAAAALNKAATNASTAAFTTAYNAAIAGMLSSKQAYAAGFAAAAMAAQAVGASRDVAIQIAWNAIVTFAMTAGYGQGQAEGYATTAQADAGFGVHTNQANQQYGTRT